MRADLGPYLKARRGQLRPDDVGLVAHTPRRVPGLRREEVSMLAGISVDYYTRLEQGRERNPSPSVLDTLSSVLRLDGDQRDYVFRLAGLAPAPVAAPVPVPSPPLRDLLDTWSQTPAMVINRCLDVLACNRLAGALYADFARVDNLVRMTFLDPAGRRFYADWNTAAEACVASLRLALPYVTAADDVHTLVAEMSDASASFRRLWAKRDVRGKTRDDKAFHHRTVGDVVLAYHAFDVKEAPGHQLVVYHAVPGSPSAEKLHLLASLHAESELVRDSRASGRP